jgi:glucosyl-dolichyl phosphate glucuronosyltransferase
VTPRITVAVCTWNRAQSLQRALESILAAVDVLGRSIQLVVVNNNCTDHTETVLEVVAKQIPVTYVRESRVGLANARNAAIGAADGDYIVWTDDDAVVSAPWLEAYSTAFIEHPDAAFFGGPIRPLFEGTPPAWLAEGWRKVASIYATRDLGDRPFRITGSENLPFGANFAVSSDVQRQIRYDPRFGRQPANYWLVGEETEMLTRLLEKGREGWWVPAADVLHCIPPDRQTLLYVVKYGFGAGQTQELRHQSPGRRRILGSPAWLWRHWATALGRAVFALAAERPERWLPAVYRAAQLAGRLSRGRRRRAARRPLPSSQESSQEP